MYMKKKQYILHEFSQTNNMRHNGQGQNAYLYILYIIVYSKLLLLFFFVKLINIIRPEKKN